MELSKRIEKIVEYSGLSIPKFAEFVGFKTPQAVRENAIVTAKRVVMILFFARFIKFAPFILYNKKPLNRRA